MKIIKSIQHTNRMFRLIPLFAVIFVNNVFSMDTDQQFEPGKYFIYQIGTSNGIVVNKTLAEKCGFIKNIISYSGQENEIPLDFPVDSIQLAFDVLADKSIIQTLPWGDLIVLANIFDFLEAPYSMIDIVLNKIKSYVSMYCKNSSVVMIKTLLKDLNPDLSTEVLVDLSINSLKKLIIEKKIQYRIYPLLGHPAPVHEIVLSDDGKRMVSCCPGNQNNLILWDISDLSNVKNKSLVCEQRNIDGIALSADGNRLVSCSKDNVILWDISDLRNITHKPLECEQRNINAIALSADGNRLVSCSNDIQYNLILWNITDSNNIRHQSLVGHPKSVISVGLSADGNKLVSGCYGSQNNLIVWDITDFNAITHQSLTGYLDSVYSMILSADGDKIVFRAINKQDIIVWDITDLNAIIHQSLVGHSGTVFSMALSANGNRLVSGCDGESDNLILWDISNPNDITHQTLISYPGSVFAVGLSADGNKLAYGLNNALNVLILETEHEQLLLNKLKNYNVDQIAFVYSLSLWALENKAITLQQGSDEWAIFSTLSYDMQKLLTELIFIRF